MQSNKNSCARTNEYNFVGQDDWDDKPMGMDQPITLFPYPTLTTGPCDVTVVPFPLGLYIALPFPLAYYPGHPCAYNVPLFSGVDTCVWNCLDLKMEALHC
jgi:hypothetical protein